MMGKCIMEIPEMERSHLWMFRRRKIQNQTSGRARSKTPVEPENPDPQPPVEPEEPEKPETDPPQENQSSKPDGNQQGNTQGTTDNSGSENQNTTRNPSKSQSTGSSGGTSAGNTVGSIAEPTLLENINAAIKGGSNSLVNGSKPYKLDKEILTVLAKNPNFELTLEYDNYSIKIKGADIKNPENELLQNSSRKMLRFPRKNRTKSVRTKYWNS